MRSMFGPAVLGEVQCMVFDPDLFCSLVLTAAPGAIAMVGVAGRPVIHSNGARHPLGLPTRLSKAGLEWLDRIAWAMTRIGVSAHFVTLMGLSLAAIAGVLLGLGHFGLGAVAMVLASLGDALDGLVARRSKTTSLAGALLDASADRYEEFFFLSGLAVYFRASAWTLVVTLFALAGSFMVSYGSAKAEAAATTVPPGVMRRADRAVCLCAAATLTTPFDWLVGRWHLPGRAAHLPIVVALAVLAFVTNGSAIHRLRLLARGPSPARSRHPAGQADPSSATGAATSRTAS